MAKHQLSRTWSTQVVIDTAPITVHVTRMPMADFLAWERRFVSFGGPGAESDDDPARVNEMFAWIRETLVNCVSLPHDELEVDGEPVSTGAQLFDIFGSRIGLMIDLMNRIWLWHRFEDDVRKKLLSPSASPTTSGAPAPEAAGKKQERTAGSVDSAGSAMTAGVVQAAGLTAPPSGATT